MSATKRHQWAASLREGIGERCARHGCGWERRQKETAKGEASSESEYRHDERPEWATYRRVPQCEGAL